MFHADLAKNIRPPHLVRLIESLSRSEFSAQFETPFLLVRIDGADDSELAEALLHSLLSSAVPLTTTLAFRTVVGNMAPSSGRRQAVRALRQPPVTHVRGWLRDEVHVVFALRKREASGPMVPDRIRIGRAMNNDVVLRHASISKSHAWLEMDDERNVFLFDAGSRNGTFLADARLEPRACAPLPAIAEIRFGAVTVRLCDAGLFWDAVRTP